MSGHVRGIMFNLLEQFVLESWGMDAYEGVVQRCGAASDDVFVSVLEYPDEAFFAQIDATADQLGTSRPRTLEALGRWSVPALVSRYPGALEGHEDAHACILALPAFLHLEVRKLEPSAGPPPLQCAGQRPHASVGFVAAHGLCWLVRGLLRGLAEQFSAELRLEHTECTGRGGAVCRMELELSTHEAGAA